MGSELAQTSAIYQRPEQGWVRDPPVGSSDARAPIWRRNVWIDNANFLSDENVSQLMIAPGAVNAPVLATRPVPGYYDRLLNRLTRDAPADWSILPWGWDWRQDLWTQGTSLAQHIRAQGAVEGGHRIVGHSCGGLVARACYADLVRTGDQALVPRIVTLGTPHYGTYRPAVAWAERDDLVDVVGLLGVGAAFLRRSTIGRGRFFADAAITFGGSVTAAQERYTEKALSLLTDWVSCYHLLPDPDKRDDPADVDRGMTFLTATWAEARVSPEYILLLPQAGNDPRVGPPASFQYKLHSAPAPPPNVLTCIAGTGHSTPYRIARPNERAMPSTTPRGSRTWRSFHLPVWAHTTGGDGYVTTLSALERGCRQVMCDARHEEIASDGAVLSFLFQYLSDAGPTQQPPVEVLRHPREDTEAVTGTQSHAPPPSAPLVTLPSPSATTLPPHLITRNRPPVRPPVRNNNSTGGGPRRRPAVRGGTR